MKNLLKVGDEVNVTDDSYSMIKTKKGICHLAETRGYLQNRNPWKIITFAEGLPADNSSHRLGIGDKQYNDVIIQHSIGIVASTQKRFLMKGGLR